MKKMPGGRWLREVRAAGAEVERWIRALTPEEWSEPCQRLWTRKDLLGHLSAWSNLLADQVESLQGASGEAVEAVDVDGWNEVEVARRRDWPVSRAVAEWREAVARLERIVGALRPEERRRRAEVAWAAEPVSIEDVLRLWLLHIAQHRSSLTAGQ